MQGILARVCTPGGSVGQGIVLQQATLKEGGEGMFQVGTRSSESILLVHTIQRESSSPRTKKLW